jgi:protein gp37
MSDLFHEDIPDEYIRQVFDVIRRAPQHTFQVLTKRAERMAGFFKNYTPPKNAWLGVKQWGGWGVDGKKRAKKPLLTTPRPLPLLPPHGTTSPSFLP